MGRRVMQRPIMFCPFGCCALCSEWSNQSLYNPFLGTSNSGLPFVTDVAASAGACFQKSVAWHLMSPDPDTLADTRSACRSEANRSPEPAIR